MIDSAPLAVLTDRSLPDLETLVSAVSDLERGLVVLDDLSVDR